jgi:hypothetical protein
MCQISTRIIQQENKTIDQTLFEQKDKKKMVEKWEAKNEANDIVLFQ